MKKDKQKNNYQKMSRYRLTEKCLILIFIVTFFMGIGYAKIADIDLEINGRIDANAQDGVFISNVDYLLNTDADITSSKINYYIETMLDSRIVLGEDNQSQIVYEVTIQNNTDYEQVFIDILYEDENYSNANIEIGLEGIDDLVGLEKNVTTIAPHSSISFPLTFKYIDGANITNNILESKINIRFKENPILELSNENEYYFLRNIYPDYQPHKYEFTVTNYNENRTNVVPLSYYFDITIDKPLSAKIYDENGNEVTQSIIVAGDGIEQTTHTYTLEIAWDDTNEDDGTSYNSEKYASQEFNCDVVLNIIPDDEKYLGMVSTKTFGVIITSSDYRENCEISYINITNNNYPTESKYGEDLEITFVDEIPVEIEVSGCESYIYNRPVLQIYNVSGDLQIENATGDIMIYEKKEETTFNGNNLINTQIALFNRENIDKDFEISFEIVSLSNTQSDYATLMNGLREASPYPGILVRIRNNRYELVAQQEADNIQYAELSEISKFKYIRRNGIIYYQINDGQEIMIENFQGFTNYFDTPITFGGSLNSSGSAYRYFNGKLSNMQIILLGEREEVDKDETVVYEYIGEYRCNGSSVLNTRIPLFNEENINKDFEISFDVISYANNQSDYATLVNSLYEVDPFPGILVRIRNNRYEIVAQHEPDNIHYVELSEIMNFKYIRRNGIVYYQINEGAEVMIENFQGFTNYFDTPVTFGGSLDGDGDPYRFFNGTIANMKIKLTESSGTTDDIVYKYEAEYTCTGSSVLNTRIQLFNRENINKDFEISFDVVSYSNTQSDYATLVNSLYEANPYPGILLRIRNNRYEIVAQQEPDNIHYAELSEINRFKYIRRDGIIYYQINDGEEVEIESFQGFTNYFDTPVTFGGALDANGDPYRYFNGTISNIYIWLSSE